MRTKTTSLDIWILSESVARRWSVTKVLLKIHTRTPVLESLQLYQKRDWDTPTQRVFLWIVVSF